jgi:2,3-bisphosphoglycerate-dependent phosphoglycerate mutase
MRMTTVYYVRHARPNHHNHDDSTRELTAEGLRDRHLVTDYLRDTILHAVLSSPYKRAVDTVAPLAEERSLPVEIIDDFRERRVASEWLEDFHTFSRRQWDDFSYKLPDGESLEEVRLRNIRALEDVLMRYAGKTVVIGGHGAALSTILRHYDPSFDYASFQEMQGKMPWIVKLVFRGKEPADIQKMDLIPIP